MEARSLLEMNAPVSGLASRGNSWQAVILWTVYCYPKYKTYHFFSWSLNKTQLKHLDVWCSPISNRTLLRLKGLMLWPIVLRIRVVLRWVWSNGGMILTGENWSTGRKTLYTVGGRWMNEYWAMVEWYWPGKTEVLGEKHYRACVVDGWMSMEQWWNDTDRGKLKYWEKNIIQRGW
jgi:hypothetical protein